MATILYITNGISGAGGLERVLSVKASYLADVYGYEVHIASLNEGGKKNFYEFSPKLHRHNIVAIGNPVYYFRAYLTGIKDVISKVKPDVICVCDDGFKAFLLPTLLSKPCPMIYERHVSKLIAFKGQSVLRRMITKLQFLTMDRLAETYDAFVVLTDGNKKEWPVRNLKVISNPTSFYPDQTSTLLNKKVIAVGKQGYQKGYDRLLQSWALVNKEHPDWKLEIYGTIDPAANLEQLASSLSLGESVAFYPPEQDIKSKYLDASIYAMSSRYEGFGMVLIEAMACGVPCVSYDCPCGPADIISDGVDGFLVPNGDTKEFAEKIIELIQNPQLRTKMGTSARQNVKRFLPDNIMSQWDHLFKTLAR